MPLLGAALVHPAARFGPRSWPSGSRLGSRWSCWRLPSIVIAVEFEPGGAHYQFVEYQPWIPAFGTGYILGVDGIALVLVVLTAVLVPLLIVAGWNDAGDQVGLRGRARLPIALTLAVEGMVLISLIVAGRPAVLRLLRGHAHPDVLPHRRLRQASRAVAARR